MARVRNRTQVCGTPQARQRLKQAQSFLEVAELTADVGDAQRPLPRTSSVRNPRPSTLRVSSEPNNTTASIDSRPCFVQ
jgi:hypothetical protein